MPYNDPEKQRAANREACRRYRAKNPEKTRQRQRRWRKANPEKARARVRRYRERNLGKDSDRSVRRRALKANAPQGDSAEAVAYAEILREGICELCGSHGPIEIDHIIPLSTGGEHGWENFAGLCQSCNSGKKDTSLLLHLLR